MDTLQRFSVVALHSLPCFLLETSPRNRLHGKNFHAGYKKLLIRLECLDWRGFWPVTAYSMGILAGVEKPGFSRPFISNSGKHPERRNNVIYIDIDYVPLACGG